MQMSERGEGDKEEVDLELEGGSELETSEQATSQFTDATSLPSGLSAKKPKRKEEEEIPYKLARAKMSFHPSESREVFLNVGDRIVLYFDDPKNEWWNGRNLNTNEVGWFPASHVDVTKKLYKSEKKTIQDMEMILMRYAKSRKDLGQKVEVEDLRQKMTELACEWVDKFVKKYPSILSSSKGTDVVVTTSSMVPQDDGSERDVSQQEMELKNISSTDLAFAETGELESQESSTRRNNSQSHLTEDQEKQLLKWIEEQYAAGKSPTPNDLRYQATELARRTDPSKQMFSSSWVTRFKRRHPQILQKLKFKHNDNNKGRVLEEDEEEELANWVRDRNNSGETPTRRELSNKVMEVIRKKDPKSPQVSRKAIVNFHVRHPDLRVDLNPQFGLTYFKEDEEEEIVKWIQDKHRSGKTATPTDVINMALKIAQKRDPNKSSFTYDWFYGFRDRHPEIQITKQPPHKRKRDDDGLDKQESGNPGGSPNESDDEGDPERKKSTIVGE